MFNFNNLSKVATRTISMAGLSLKKHSPELLVIAGVTGVVISTIQACKATTKIGTLMEDTKDTVTKIHECHEDPSRKEEYSDEDYKKDLVITYTRTGVELAKLYGPSVVIGTVSIGCILMSHNIMKNRNAALAAAYTAVSNSFNAYRKNVVDRFGETIDKELKYGIKQKEIETTTTDANGNPVVKKEMAPLIDDDTKPLDHSVYAKFFDEGCPDFCKDPEKNLYFLRTQERNANELLERHGYLFLNDVYKMLGIPQTRAGQVAGWIYDPKAENADSYVSFGIYDIRDERHRAFVNGQERCILLDFNVQGNIMDSDKVF